MLTEKIKYMVSVISRGDLFLLGSRKTLLSQCYMNREPEADKGTVSRGLQAEVWKQEV